MPAVTDVLKAEAGEWLEPRSCRLSNWVRRCFRIKPATTIKEKWQWGEESEVWIDVNTLHIYDI